MRSFTTEGQQVTGTEGLEPIPFTLDGAQYTAQPPSETQFALLLASMSDTRGTEEGLAAILDFFFDLFDDEDADALKKRLHDRKDPFGFPMMQEILENLVEEWTDRPTKPSSGSTTSRKSTGRSSTAKPRSKASISKP